MSRRTFDTNQLRRIVMIALFGAISYVLMLVIHIPVQFLTMDVKDVIIILAGLYFGPLASIVLSILVPLLEMVTVSTTGPYGLVMNILSTASLSVTASVIYKYRKNLFGAIVGLFSGGIVMIAVMMAFNLLVTPHYLHAPVAEVQKLIPVLLLPFNALKATLNIGLVLFLYKPLSVVMQRAGILPRSERAYRMDLRSVLILIASLILIAGSIALIVFVLGGGFQWGWK